MKSWIAATILAVFSFLALVVGDFFNNSLPPVFEEEVVIIKIENKYPKKIQGWIMEVFEYTGQEFSISVASESAPYLRPGDKLALKYFYKEEKKCLLGMLFEGDFVILSPLQECLALKTSSALTVK